MYDKVDYILVHTKQKDMLGTGYLPQEIQDEYISKLYNDGNHELVFSENELLLFKRLE